MSSQPLLNARTFFETIAPKAVSKRAAQGILPKAIATFRVVGDEAASGTWTLRLGDGQGSVVEEDCGEAQLRVTILAQALADALAGKLDAATAMESGMMILNGDPKVLSDLAFLFQEPTRPWNIRSGEG